MSRRKRKLEHVFLGTSWDQVKHFSENGAYFLRFFTFSFRKTAVITVLYLKLLNSTAVKFRVTLYSTSLDPSKYLRLQGLPLSADEDG